MHNSRHILIPVIGLPGAREEHSILEEKGLIPREALFEEVSLAGLILLTETVLVQDGVKLFLCLLSDIEVQVFISVSNILAQVNFTQVDGAGEYPISIVHNHIASSVGFRYGEEEHVLDVGGRHDPSPLADRPHWPNPDLLSHFGADNGLRLMVTLRGVRVREVGMELVPEKLFNHCDLAVVWLREVPDVRHPFGMTLSGFPWTGQ